MDAQDQSSGLEWQVTIWNQMAQLYAKENAPRMLSVADRLVALAGPMDGDHVLDVGTGSGSVVKLAAGRVGERGHVVGIDISPEMLVLAQRELGSAGPASINLLEGGAESIPADDDAFDIVLACLCLMFVVDRATAAREIARVLRPGGRFVASVWAGPEHCDLVRFQQIAGRYAAVPPVPGAGPGALADPSPFLLQLADAGIPARVEVETHGFHVDSFDVAWEVFANVTAAKMSAEREEEAKRAVLDAMWPDGDGPRYFQNGTQFIIGQKALRDAV